MSTEIDATSRRKVRLTLTRAEATVLADVLGNSVYDSWGHRLDRDEWPSHVEVVIGEVRDKLKKELAT